MSSLNVLVVDLFIVIAALLRWFLSLWKSLCAMSNRLGLKGVVAAGDGADPLLLHRSVGVAQGDHRERRGGARVL